MHKTYEVPGQWNEMLEKRTISEDMLGETLFSVNKRAKNVWNIDWQNAHPEKDTDDFLAEEKSCYEKKDKLLTLAEPVCIHREHNMSNTKRYFDDEENFFDNLTHCLCAGLIVGDGEYVVCDGERVTCGGDPAEPGEKTGRYFDAISMDEEDYAYYLYYLVGMHGFHHPIERADVEGYVSRYRIPVVDISTINSMPHDEADLAPMEFVDSVLQLIDSGTYMYEPDPWGHDDSWFDTSYEADIPEEDALENIFRAMQHGWHKVLIEKAEPLVLEKIDPYAEKEPGDALIWELEKQEENRIRMAARRKKDGILVVLKHCKKELSEAKTKEDFRSLRKSLKTAEKKFRKAIREPEIRATGSLIDYFLWDDKFCEGYVLHDFSNMQEMVDYVSAMIADGVPLPEKVDKIVLRCYEENRERIRDAEFSPARAEYEALLKKVDEAEANLAGGAG